MCVNKAEALSQTSNDNGFGLKMLPIVLQAFVYLSIQGKAAGCATLYIMGGVCMFIQLHFD